MSGGRFDYIDSRCKSEIFGWDDRFRNVFEDREISELIFDVFDLIHDYDWYASGDTGEGKWLTAKDALEYGLIDGIEENQNANKSTESNDLTPPLAASVATMLPREVLNKFNTEKNNVKIG